jgi:spore coat protein A
VSVGSKLILFNDATGPFPGGDMGPTAPAIPGYGPDTMNLLQFQVVPLGTVTGDSSPDPVSGPLKLPPLPGFSSVDAVRNVTLNEGIDEYGRVTPFLGTLADGPLMYHDSATETPNAGSVEVWNIFNLTADAHPIHIHLANFQIIGRAPIDEEGEIEGPFKKPDANEAGWKDTVRANFGEVTRVIMKFDLPPSPPGVTVPESPRTGGHEYVWHCHILEHEEHDMMRPLIVT